MHAHIHTAYYISDEMFLCLQNITFEGFDDVLAVVEEIGVEEGGCG